MLCFFNLAGAIYDPDLEGHEAASMSDARILAATYLAEVIRERPDAVWTGDEVRVEVTNANQLVLFTIIAFGVDSPAGAGEPASFAINFHPACSNRDCGSADAGEITAAVSLAN